MKSHALYEEVHNFLKGKAPQFEKELQLIRQSATDHSDYGGYHSRTSSNKFDKHNSLNQPDGHLRSLSRESGNGGTNSVVSNNGLVNRQKNQGVIRESDRIREEREEHEETLVNEEDENPQILQKYHQTDAYHRLKKRQALAVRRLECIKANFEKKRKQVNMLGIERQDNMAATSGGVPFSHTTPMIPSIDAFSPSNIDEQNQARKIDIFSKTQKVQTQKPPININGSASRPARFHISSLVSNSHEGGFSESHSINKPYTAFSGSNKHVEQDLPQNQDMASHNSQLKTFNQTSFNKQQQHQLQSLNNHNRPPVGQVIQNQLNLPQAGVIPQNLLLQNVDPFYSKKNRPTKGHFNDSSERQKHFIQDYQVSDLPFKNSLSTGSSQENSIDRGSGKKPFTGIQTYKNAIKRNKKYDGPAEPINQEAYDQKAMWSQTSKFSLRNKEDSRDRATGNGTNLGYKNRTQYLIGAINQQKPMTAGHEGTKILRRRNIQIQQQESSQSYSPSKDQKYLCMSKPQDYIVQTSGDNQHTQSNEQLQSNHFKSQNYEPSDRSRYQTLQLQQPSLQNPIVEANSIENTECDDTKDEKYHLQQQSLEEYSKTAQLNGLNNHFKDYNSNPISKTSHGKGMKKFGSSKPESFYSKRLNCSTNVGLSRTPYQKKEASVTSDQAADTQGLKNKPANISGIQRYNMARKYIQENINSKQYWPSGMTHPDDYRVFYWAPDMSFCGFAANHIFKRNSSTRQKEGLNSPPKIPKSENHHKV